MKKTFLLALAVASAFTAISYAEPEPTKKEDTAPTPAQTLTPQQAMTLADACRLTQLINEDKWDEVEKMLGGKDGMLDMLRHHASLKEWQGIGAYRGTTINKVSPLSLTHRFGFAPKTHPHEIWISYQVTEAGPSKPGLMVMGW